MNRLLLFFIPIKIFADVIFSNIPISKIEIINLEIESCKERCLNNLSKDGKIMSFIARFDKNIEDEELQNLMREYANEIGIYYKIPFESMGDKIEVALLMPKKIIGKYSTSTIDTVLSYLLFRNINFRFKIFDNVDESREIFEENIEKIKNENFNFLIAIVSNKDNVALLEELKMPIYIPTMMGSNSRSNIVFGGIDYQAQIKTLSDAKQDNANTIIYNDDSSLGRFLGDVTKSVNENVKIEDSIDNKVAANFYQNIQRAKDYIEGANIYLNTPVVKSGLLLSQINSSNIKPGRILSTQVNYNPALLSLIKGIDFENIIIANSINVDMDKKLIEYGKLLNSDITYDWVNYSTALGIDFFTSKMNKKLERYFKEEIDNNQVVYGINLYSFKNGRFIKY